MSNMWITSMTPTEELIVYLANNFPNQNLTQLVMHKLLYFVDKSALQKLGRRITTGPYKANKWGPTHNHLNAIEHDLAAWVNVLRKGSKTYYVGLNNRQGYSFDKEELAVIDEVIKKYKNAKTDVIIEDSHDEYWEELYKKGQAYQYTKYDSPIIDVDVLSGILKSANNKKQ